MAESLAKSPDRVVNPDVLQLAPSLLNAPLATPWQRLGGMVVDLIVISMLSRFSSPVLGLCAGAALAAFGSRRESEARFWNIFRWVLIGLGAVIIVISGLLLRGGPVFRSFIPAPGASSAAPAVGRTSVSASTGDTELRAEVLRLRAQVDALHSENARLRESATSQALFAAVTELPRTVGLAFGWAGVYFTLLPTFFRGRTPGKFIFGSRVVRLDGKPPSAIDCFWRSGGYPAGLATGCLGFLRLIWEPNHQALQDNIAGTLVLSTRRKARVASQRGMVATEAGSSESAASGQGARSKE